MLVPNGARAYIQPLPDANDGAKIRFHLVWPTGNESEYYKPWWRGHLHALRLIFRGFEVEYVDPPEEEPPLGI